MASKILNDLVTLVENYDVKSAPPAGGKSKSKKKFTRSKDSSKRDFADCNLDIPKEYDPAAVEKHWDKRWENAGLYAPNEPEKPSFVMMIPPPNVTGSLHNGHALMCSIEDAMTRYWRMKGKNCLWLPGTDHAGIATQSVVERLLFKKENLTRHDLGREKFLERVWEWKNIYGGRISNQLRRLGCSVDWSREVFTMDPKLNKSVTEAFCRMFDSGIVYRSDRLCNWSCALMSAISDAEVRKQTISEPKKFSVPGYEKMIKFGVIHEFSYKVVGSDDRLTVATTRLETMLGDTAVAVHPDDPRYKHLHGKMLEHPFVAGRKMPIITDKILVDMTKGTGAVKVTPAHDPNDYDCGNRNNLEFINILTDDGLINENGGKFKGMKRYDARYEVMKALKEIGLFVGEKKNEMAIGFCDRSGDVIEPRIKPQWWVNCENMAKRSTDAVRNGELVIGPDEIGKKQFFDYLDNIRPWCVSRQMWWGHRIPAYQVEVDGKLLSTGETGSWVVGRNDEEAMANALKKFPNKKIKLHRDPDVLDTWFSSGIFPFSTLGWPDDTEDMKQFFPGHVLETGGDIIFFWVARMVMMSLELMDKLPFTHVFLHPMVRDKYGAKMSKSKGNVINPLHVIDSVTLDTLLEELHSGNVHKKDVAKYEKEKKKDYAKGIPACGADALRFGLLAYVLRGGNINLDVDRVVGYRHFLQKLWQITRYTLLTFEWGEKPFTPLPRAKFGTVKPLTTADRWILSRLAHVIKETDRINATYIFGDTVLLLHNFLTKEFKNDYLELTKPYFNMKDPSPEKLARQRCAQQILYITLDCLLRMLHPLTPFVTEELYQFLPGHKKGEFIMAQPYPEHMDQWNDPEAETDMELVLNLCSATRAAKESLGLTKKDRPEMVVVPFGAVDLADKLSAHTLELSTLSLVSSCKVLTDVNDPQLKKCLPVMSDDRFKVFLGLTNEVDVPALVKKKEKELKKMEKYVKTLEKKANNPKSPPAIRQKDQDKLDMTRSQMEEKRQTLKILKSL